MFLIYCNIFSILFQDMLFYCPKPDCLELTIKKNMIWAMCINDKPNLGNFFGSNLGNQMYSTKEFPQFQA